MVLRRARLGLQTGAYRDTHRVLYFEGCPHAAGARALLRACIDRLGLALEGEEREGDFPSPTILIDGRDVMGQPRR
jgi:hypothetical protein